MGATNQVTCDKIQFIILHKIKLIKIKLPNDTFVIAEYIGTVKFSKLFIIFNVLYILNLIFVQRLIDDMNCKLVFSSKVCQIQNNATV